MAVNVWLSATGAEPKAIVIPSGNALSIKGGGWAAPQAMLVIQDGKRTVALFTVANISGAEIVAD